MLPTSPRNAKRPPDISVGMLWLSTMILIRRIWQRLFGPWARGRILKRDIELLRHPYPSTLDPVYPKGAKKFFGSRAVIDACRPYDWIEDFPRVAESSEAEKQKVLKKWKELFG